MFSTRRLLHDGMVASNTMKYQRPDPLAKLATLKIMPKPPNSDLNKDASVTFLLNTSPNELVRFPDHPFVVTYKIRCLNIDYSATSEDPIKKIQFTAHFPKENAPRTYWDTRLGAASMFSKLEVTLDQTIMSLDALEEYGFLYDGAANTFCTESSRMLKYGRTMARPSTEKGYTDTAADLIDKNLQEVLADNSMDERKPTSGNITTAFGFGGKFPLDSGCLPLSNLFGMQRKNGWIHSNAEIQLRLIKRAVLYSCMENALMSADTFVGVEPVAGNAKVDVSNYKIDIVNIGVLYYSIELENQQLLQKLNSKLHTYYHDKPSTIFRRQPAGASFHSEVIALPAGTRLVMIQWAVDDQVVYNPTSGKFLSPRMRFPKGCTKLDVSISGKSGLILENGLQDFANPEKRRSSISCLAYHKDLMSKGLYDSKAEKMFPRPTDSTNDGGIVLDLTSYSIPASTNLTLTTSFTDGNDLSPKNTSLVVHCVQQMKVEYDKSKRWTWSVVNF